MGGGLMMTFYSMRVMMISFDLRLRVEDGELE